MSEYYYVRSVLGDHLTTEITSVLSSKYYQIFKNALIGKRLAPAARRVLKHGLHNDQARVRAGSQTATALEDRAEVLRYQSNENVMTNSKLHVAKAH